MGIALTVKVFVWKINFLIVSNLNLLMDKFSVYFVNKVFIIIPMVNVSATEKD